MTHSARLSMKQTKDMEKQLFQYRQALFWNEGELNKQREVRFRCLLQYAKAMSPWYRDKLRHINVEKFTLDRLPSLPVLTKETLMENWDSIVTNSNLSLSLAEQHLENLRYHDNALYLHDRYHVLATSGSSGRRGVFIYDWDEWNIYYLMYHRYGFKTNNRVRSVLNPLIKNTIAVIGAVEAVYGIVSLAKTYQTRNSKTVHFNITLPIEKIVDELNHLQPNIIQSNPSSVAKLCKEVTLGRLDINPLVISVGAEPFYEPIRKAIETVWPSAWIYNTYGASEGIAGVCCSAGSKEMHLNDDLCIVEPVDSNNSPVKKGIISNKIYITNLFNYTLPLIRYEIPDTLLFLDKKCECGVNHQLIAEPQGKASSDFLYSSKIRIAPIVFATPLLHEKYILEYQVKQTKNGVEIYTKTTGKVNYASLKNAFRSKLTEAGLIDPDIQFVNVSEFKYPASGKLKRFISSNFLELN